MGFSASGNAILAGLVAIGLALPAAAQNASPAGAAGDSGALDADKAKRAHERSAVYSPYADRKFPTQPFFGDTHLHTAFSMDAGAFGARLTPRDAYRFARGEQVVSSTGQPVKLSRPLDFLVVADHSDNMGFFPDLFAGKPNMLADPTGRKWYDMIQSGKGADAALEIIVAFSHGTFPGHFLCPRHPALPQRLAGDHRRGRGLQRAGPLHRFHRLRVDLQHRRQQPAPQRDLPRRRREGEPGRALHRLPAAGQRQSGGPVEVDGRLRGNLQR
jgi:hypothetical protein